MTPGVIEIAVPERGTTLLAPSTWRMLEKSDGFWQLAESKVISVEQQSPSGIRLRGGPYIGRVKLGPVVLQVHEKIPGAAIALMEVVAPALKVARIDSLASEFGGLITLIVSAFLDSVEEYCGRGRDWRYSFRPDISSTIAGRLDVKRTIALRARGRRHLAAFRRTVVSAVTPTNRVVLAALREVEVVAALQNLRDSDVRRSRALSLFFEDCLDSEILARSSSLATDAGWLASNAPPDRASMLSIASLLISHYSLELERQVDHQAPIAWFVNLELLFERAVLASMNDTSPAGVRVSKGAGFQRTVFPERSVLTADPDLVVESEAHPLAIGDVKYKAWEGSATASDLYQLLVHARTFGASDAFLVYPHSRFEQIDLGYSATGARTQLFAVDVLDLARDVARLPGVTPVPVAQSTTG